MSNLPPRPDHDTSMLPTMDGVKAMQIAQQATEALSRRTFLGAAGLVVLGTATAVNFLSDGDAHQKAFDADKALANNKSSGTLNSSLANVELDTKASLGDKGIPTTKAMKEYVDSKLKTTPSDPTSLKAKDITVDSTATKLTSKDLQEAIQDLDKKAEDLKTQLSKQPNQDLSSKADQLHGHVISDVGGLQSTLNGKAGLVHSHIIADVTGLQSALNAAGSNSGWNKTGNPSTNPSTDFIGTTDAQDFVLRTNNVERMRILNNGSVGIGVATTGSDRLRIVPSATSDIAVRVQNSPGRDVAFQTSNNVSAAWAIGQKTSGNNRFAIWAGGDTVTSPEALSIDYTTRNVGIGTSAPAQLLHVNNTTNSATILAQTTTSAGNVASFKAQSPIGNFAMFVPDNSNKLGFYDFNASAERLTILGNGNVGIGTSTPTHPLHVVENVNDFTYTTQFQNLNTGANAATALLLRSGPGALDPLTEIGVLSSTSTAWYGYGTLGDTFIRAGSGTKNINIISANGATTGSGNIQFFAGGGPDDLTRYPAGTATLALKAVSGSTGNVGIGTLTPAASLDITTAPINGLGLVTAVLNSTTITGDINTRFLSQFQPEQVIIIGGIGYAVVSIATDQSLTVNNIISPGFVAQPYTIGRQSLIVRNGGIVSHAQSANSNSNELTLRKRGATGNINGPVAISSELGYIGFRGWDGAAYGRGAYIIARSTETFGSTAHGADLDFHATYPGQVDATKRLGIKANGDFQFDNLGLGPALIMRGSGGTVGAPVPVAVNEDIGLLGVRGYNSGLGGDGFPTGSSASIGFPVSELHTLTARGTGIQFRTTPTGTAATQNSMVITPNGNVGIGTTNPVYNLQVANNSSNSILSLHRPSTAPIANPTLILSDGVNTNGWLLQQDTVPGPTLGYFNISSVTTDAAGTFVSTVVNVFSIQHSTGRVGINKSIPTSNLDVEGSVATTVAAVGDTDVLTLDSTHSTIIYYNAGGVGSATINLPDPALCRGRIYRFSVTSMAESIVINALLGTSIRIAGVGNLITHTVSGAHLALQSDGAGGWWSIA